MNVFDYFFESSQGLDKDFLLGGKETVSYKKLFADSQKVAAYLRENVGQDKPIILLSPNSVFFITAYLGILKSGNFCIPLNYAIERSNLDYILETTESTFIFCTTA
ncbi:MAG: long-chain fatty acid--CoA ligase, partial [Eudoraea sp.]|nr:long-chain fatty acid--CoA ligase [Eudoraea sp.]